MSRRCAPAAASVLRGSAGSALLCLARAMSLCRAPAACGAGPSGGGSSSARLSPPWLRLPAVPGADPGRTNDLLLLLPPPEEPPPPRHHVVYFPGDVQNYHDVMACHPENFQWACWSLENDLQALLSKIQSDYLP
ncbi:mitochondrial protein C2orf69 homolog isoform X2 [Pelodiscus sinensis]|uniref:mitochondrial protein C2orf69 homolog isoform X2 n=1 Tax=Pelodiscus sinensis TaxID=13735 RepID=UPI003F6C818F